MYSAACDISGKWNQIYYILKFYNKKPELNELCRTHLLRWNNNYNNSYTSPSKEQLDRLVSISSQFKNSRDRQICDVLFTINLFT
ncbi:MAG: hypothetical protein JW982_03630 [Spirochaetes bacterium]|nr:hypothetical protein [Spirochaetota bacterium]